MAGGAGRVERLVSLFSAVVEARKEAENAPELGGVEPLL